MILNRQTCVASFHTQFDTHESTSNAEKLVDSINYLHDGVTLIGVSFEEPTANLHPAFQLLSAAGVHVEDLNYGGKFAFVLQKGYPERTVMVKAPCCTDRIPLHVATPNILTINADDCYELFIDGVEIESPPNVCDCGLSATVILPPSFSVIAIKGLNWYSSAGIFAYDVKGFVYTDTSWKCTDILFADWKEVDFDDSSWMDAVIPVWTCISLFDANLHYQPIWTAQVKDNGTVYCRKNFGITFDLKVDCVIELVAYGRDDNLMVGNVTINSDVYLQSANCPGYESHGNWQGVNTFIVDPESCTASYWKQYDTGLMVTSADDMEAQINYLHQGAVLIGVSYDEPTTELGPAISTLSMAGVDVSDVKYGGKFAFVMQKGYPEKTVMKKDQCCTSVLQLKVLLQGSIDDIHLTMLHNL